MRSVVDADTTHEVVESHTEYVEALLSRFQVSWLILYPNDNSPTAADLI